MTNGDPPQYGSVCIYVFIIHIQKLVYEGVSTVGNLEEKLGLLWQGEKWGWSIGAKAPPPQEGKETLLSFTKNIM